MGGATDFVHKRHGMGAQAEQPVRESDTLESLKVVVPKERRSKRREQAAPTRTLEGTDPGDFDETLTDINGDQANHPQRDHQEHPYDRGYAGQIAVQPGTSADDYSEGKHVPDDPLTEPGYVQQQSDPIIQRGSGYVAQLQGNQIAMHHAKGSTYPSTTSGRPSESEPDHNGGIAENAAFSVAQHPSKARQQPGPRPEPATNQNASVAVQRGPFRRPEVPVKDEFGHDYNYAPAAPLKTAGRHHQHPAYLHQSNAASVANNANVVPPAHVPRLLVEHASRNQNVEQEWVPAAPPPQATGRHRGHQQEPNRGTEEYQYHAANPVQHADPRRQVKEQVEQQFEPTSSPEREANFDQDAESDAAQLDYEVADLMDMDYSELKTQSFDYDPRLSYQIPAGLEERPLAEKLAGIMDLNSEKQAQEFLYNLPLDEWEQAGDWFIQGFSDITTKLVDARKEKRRIVVALENEIERRYKSIGRKRKETDAALSEMRVSGAQVLAGTPKKSKTK